MPPVFAAVAAVAGAIKAAAAAYAALSALAQLAIITAIQFAGYYIAGKLRGKGQPPEATSVTARVAEGVRYIAAGKIKVGGSIVWAGYDSENWLCMVVAHCDSILVSVDQYYLDDFEAPVNANGQVTSSEFTIAVGDETANPFFIQSTTFTADNPVPPRPPLAISEFGAFWTSEHKLTGVSYSIMRIAPVDIEDRQKVYKYRGSLGLGEPSPSVVGNWSKIYDPRDPTQTLGQPSTYKFSTNLVLIWAWFRTHPFGRNKTESSINWDMVAEQADIADENVTGLDGVVKRYHGGIAVPEDKERHIAEQEILAACDAIIQFDHDGKTWVRVGKYYQPTLGLSRSRDIFSMESIDSTNVEDENQGVIVRYMDPLSGWKMQPSAPWYNPRLYKPGEKAKFLTVDVPVCQDHNHAMRLAKIIGERSQHAERIGPGVGLRGLLLRKERFVSINYDNTIAGEYEVVSNVEIDPTGSYTSFAAVPITPDRFDLLAGEEKARPQISAVSSQTFDPTTYEGGLADLWFTNGRVNVSFDYSSNTEFTGVTREVEFAPDGTTAWRPAIKSAEGNWVSDFISDAEDYKMRYRDVTQTRNGNWVEPETTIPTTIPTSITLITDDLSTRVDDLENPPPP